MVTIPVLKYSITTSRRIRKLPNSVDELPLWLTKVTVTLPVLAWGTRPSTRKILTKEEKVTVREIQLQTEHRTERILLQAGIFRRSWRRGRKLQSERSSYRHRYSNAGPRESHYRQRYSEDTNEGVESYSPREQVTDRDIQLPDRTNHTTEIFRSETERCSSQTRWSKVHTERTAYYTDRSNRVTNRANQIINRVNWVTDWTNRFTEQVK